MFFAASPMLVRVVRAGCVAYRRSSSYALHDGTRASTLERAERRLGERSPVTSKVTQCDRCHSVPQLERDPTTDLEAVIGPGAIDATIRRLTPAAWIPAWSGALYAADVRVTCSGNGLAE